ncbi:ATP synthase F1 subunit epsilon [Candidatus Endowatersipora endosymbiont of Watersipora subatra]|uniref:ATP synthase F1 subunit epsilon n=1 Tax=Candidatus Endowatersipora endosymbiont of Watersipora subatra TaxID=3077946 RepID=UPI00312CA35D
MADNFAFELVSPDNLFFSDHAEIVIIPGMEGDMGILSNHAPLIVSLRPGFVRVKLSDSDENSYFISGGFADIMQSHLILLATYFIPKSDMTHGLLKEQIKKVNQRFDKKNDDVSKAMADFYIRQLLSLEDSI